MWCGVCGVGVWGVQVRCVRDGERWASEMVRGGLATSLVYGILTNGCGTNVKNGRGARVWHMHVGVAIY